VESFALRYYPGSSWEKLVRRPTLPRPNRIGRFALVVEPRQSLLPRAALDTPLTT
jgi:hypothetical protein